jgi:hypothetical protein
LFGRQDAYAAGLTLRTTYTLTPRVTLQLYAQLFGESIAYRDFTTTRSATREVALRDLAPAPPPAVDPSTSNATLNASAVFRWEWHLGSTLYLVYTRAQAASRTFAANLDAPVPWSDGLGAASSQVVLAKLSYWW